MSFDLGMKLIARGVQRDAETAVALFHKAAKQQHAGAVCKLADCLLDGTRCEADHTQALALLSKATMEGCEEAGIHLSKLMGWV